MKKLFLITLVAIVTAGCAPALYKIRHPQLPSPYYRHTRPYAPEQPTGRWDNVMRLPRASTIDVLTQDGAATIGQIAGTDVRSVRLTVDGTEIQIARADVIRVDLVDVAGSETVAVARKAARGALLGAGLVALVTGVAGDEFWPPPGQALRAGAALGGVAAGQTEVSRRAGRLIYLAPEQAAQPPPGNRGRQSAHDRPGAVERSGAADGPVSVPLVPLGEDPMEVGAPQSMVRQYQAQTVYTMPGPAGHAPSVLRPVLVVGTRQGGIIACEGPAARVTAPRTRVR